MDGRLSEENIATRKGSFAVQVSLLFHLPATTVCTGSFLDALADAIVSCVGRTNKSLLRLYCSESTVKVQILNTYVPVQNLRSNDDVALELQRQLSFSESPFLMNVTGVDPSFLPPPIQVTNCSDSSIMFEPSCSGRPGLQTSWLGLEPDSYSTILIFVAAGMLVCLLFAICAMCVRRFLQDHKRGQKKAKWIVAVQKEQAKELEVANRRPAKKESPEASSLLPLTIPIPSLAALPSIRATPSPSPRPVPKLEDPDSNLFHEYEADVSMDTPQSGDAYENTFVLEECYDIEDREDCQITEKDEISLPGWPLGDNT